MSNGIKKSFITIEGKRVPLFKIPTGTSGLSVEAKIAQKLGEKDNQNYRVSKSEDVEEYLDTGEINSPEVIDFMSSTHEFSEMELFDKIND